MQSTEGKGQRVATTWLRNQGFFPDEQGIDFDVVAELLERFKKTASPLTVGQAVFLARNEMVIEDIKEFDGQSKILVNDGDWYSGSELYAVEAYSQSGAGPTAQDNAIEAANDRVAQHERDKPHETVPVKVWADIDIEMSPHVAYLNTIEGFRTHASCQGMEHGPHPYEAYIMASWPESTEAELRERYTIEPLGKSWGYLHPIASKSGLLSGAGSPEETKPDLRTALVAAIPFIFEYGKHANDRCYKYPSDYRCFCGLDEAKKIVEAALGAASSSQGAEPTEPKVPPNCSECGNPKTEAMFVGKGGRPVPSGSYGCWPCWNAEAEAESAPEPTYPKPEDNLTELAKLYERAATPPRLQKLLADIEQSGQDWKWWFDMPKTDRLRLIRQFRAGGGSTGKRAESD